ncbi:DDB1- and CUL4-associated factor 4-like [Ylistrum balloti]|uniref:DDB1- and CUL4-associated factor 4-like n=1 Tax=Ylistrum balloti TaxID=509963 RepID=UPI002905E132|nr:DDB1- and CUL4-associated factor 4-like [Ylistrum balloti]
MKRNELIAKWQKQDRQSRYTEHKRRPKTSKSGRDDGCSSDLGKDGRQPSRQNTSRQQNRMRNRCHQKKLETTENNMGPADTLDIPGFYFDAEKRKYFRIQPNHNSTSSSTVTRETIQRKEKEQLRLKEISCRESYEKHRSSRVKTLGVKSCTDLPHLLNDLCGGVISVQKFDHLFAFKRISNINSTPAGCQRLVSRIQPTYSKLEHVHKMVVSENTDCVLGLWSKQEISNYNIQMLDIKRDKRTNIQSRLSVNIESPEFSSLVIWNKVTNLCWADLKRNYGNNRGRHVLFTTMSFTWVGDEVSMARIRQFPQTSDRENDLEFSLGHKCTWTCAWNTQGQNFSVGSEKCGLLLDVETRRLWELNTYNSDPLVQIFDTKTRYCLYSGTRKNQILSHDLRSVSTRPTTSMSQSCSVCSLRLFQDDTKLLASDVHGKVCLWDLRMRKVVQQYQGLKNQYQCIPIHVDDQERFVYGADSDGYIRFWCLKTGALMRTIPPPSALAQDFIPTVAYSERWAGEEGNAGLLMGLGDRFYLYPSMDAIDDTHSPDCTYVTTPIYF